MFSFGHIALVAILSLAGCPSNGQVYIKVVNDKDGTRLDAVRNFTELSGFFTKNATELDDVLNRVDYAAIAQFDVHKKTLRNLRQLIEPGEPVEITEPTSCSEALDDGKPSGVYKITIPGFGQSSFPVYCLADPNGGPAWTLVHRRFDGSVDFFRGWYDYKRGFGDVNGEFWLGLDKLHRITNHQEQELWISLEDFEQARADARYESFAIGDEASAYRLNVLGSFSGNATDSLQTHRGCKFTTRDYDNDQVVGNCAIKCTGAWWYDKCYTSNLNGRYLRGKTDPEVSGIEWSYWKEDYSLKYAHMAIRPVW